MVKNLYSSSSSPPKRRFWALTLLFKVGRGKVGDTNLDQWGYKGSDPKTQKRKMKYNLSRVEGEGGLIIYRTLRVFPESPNRYKGTRLGT